jgi:hypothetical protein
MPLLGMVGLGLHVGRADLIVRVVVVVVVVVVTVVVIDDNGGGSLRASTQ